jgi:hypothetical protein
MLDSARSDLFGKASRLKPLKCKLKLPLILTWDSGRKSRQFEPFVRNAGGLRIPGLSSSHFRLESKESGTTPTWMVLVLGKSQTEIAPSLVSCLHSPLLGSQGLLVKNGSPMVTER